MVARQYNLIPPVMEQPQYNMFHRQRFEIEYRQIFKEFGYGTTIWSPLASGLLTGKYNNGLPGDTRVDLIGMEWLKEKITGEEGQKNIEKIKKLQVLANDLGMTLPHLGIAWCLKNPNVSTVILGASKVEQLTENLKSLEQAEKLTPQVLEDIELILDNKPAIPTFG
jgi:aryl-alcohol dehydrogenase-like predicted oxidoreductase